MRRFVERAKVSLSSLFLLAALAHGGLHAQLVTPNREAANADLPTVDNQPVGFAGYIKDPETGLYYAGARYYDPTTGRFTTEDPEAGDVMKPPSLHRYLYSYANPTTYIDPDGRQAMPMMGQAEAMSLAWNANDRDEMRRTALAAAAGQRQGAKLSIPTIAGTYLGVGLVSALRSGWMAYSATGAAGFGLTVTAQRGAPYAEAGAELLAGVPNPISTLPNPLATLPSRVEGADARLAPLLSELSIANARAEAVALSHSEVPIANPPIAPTLPLPLPPPSRRDTVTITEGENLAASFSLTPRADVPAASRPSPRQSEIDVGNDLGPGARAQVSYLDRQEVKYGTIGSSRPDFCMGTTCSFEVKNYNIADNTPGLVSKVVEQAIQRQQNLPHGMVQRVVIDVRGQTVTPRQESEIAKSIVSKSNGAISPTNVQFKHQ
jgi:RHS repeat-associated protein